MLRKQSQCFPVPDPLLPLNCGCCSCELWAPAVTLEEWVKKEEAAARGKSQYLASVPLWAAVSRWTPKAVACQNLCCTRSAGEMWMRKECVESGALQARCSELCFAHIEALLLHSILSCRVMDLLPAAHGTGCTESSLAVFHSQHKNLQYILANRKHWTPLQFAACVWGTVNASPKDEVTVFFSPPPPHLSTFKTAVCWRTRLYGASIISSGPELHYSKR